MFQNGSKYCNRVHTNIFHSIPLKNIHIDFYFIKSVVGIIIKSLTNIIKKKVIKLTTRMSLIISCVSLSDTRQQNSHI